MNLRTISTFFATGVLLIAGGFSVEFGNPKAVNDPKAADAAVIVRAVGCHEPEKAKFTVTAEGTVDGKRQSLPVQLTALSTPGMYAVKKQWPDNGKFVLVFNATFDGHFVSSAVLPLKDGEPQRTLAKVYRRETNSQDWQ